MPRETSLEVAARPRMPPSTGPMQGVHPAANAIPTSADPRIADRLALQMQPALLGQQPDLEHAEAQQAEQDDQHAAHPLEPDLVVVERAAQRGGAGAEQDEHQREAGHEEQRVEQRGPPPAVHLAAGSSR